MDHRLQLLNFTSGEPNRLTAAFGFPAEFKLQFGISGQELS